MSRQNPDELTAVRSTSNFKTTAALTSQAHENKDDLFPDMWFCRRPGIGLGIRQRMLPHAVWLAAREYKLRLE